MACALIYAAKKEGLLMINTKRDFISGLFFLLLGVFVLIYSISLPTPNIGNGVYPNIVPLLAGIGTLVFGAILVSKVAILSKKQGIKKEKVKEEKAKTSNIPLIGTIILFAFYALCVKNIGFIVTTVVYLIAQMYLLTIGKKKHHIFIVGISVVSTMIIYIIFTYGLTLFLPKGILG